MLATAAIFLYQNMKLALKGKHFNYIRYIQCGVPKLLERVSLLIFQTAFTDLHKESKFRVDDGAM